MIALSEKMLAKRQHINAERRLGVHNILTIMGLQYAAPRRISRGGGIVHPEPLVGQGEATDVLDGKLLRRLTGLILLTWAQLN